MNRFRMNNKINKEALINPHVSVDCVVIGFDGEQIKVLLVRQVGKETTTLKLPGSLIYDDEDLDEAAGRVLSELTGIDKLTLLQFRAFGSKNRTRDPKDVKWLERFHSLNTKVERIVTIGYLSMVKIDKKMTQLLDKYHACWVQLKEVEELAFDHNQIINEALIYIRQYVEVNPSVMFDLLPKKFTAAQLRLLYELIYDRTFDVRNFHKKMLVMDYIVQLDEKQKGVPHRAARYFKFDRKVYNKLHGAAKTFNR